MSILVRFPGGATREQYDESVRRAEQMAGFPPDGLEYHVAFISDDGSVRVSEIWDSEEQMRAFGERLMPMLAELGMTLEGQPEVLEIHNIFRR